MVNANNPDRRDDYTEGIESVSQARAQYDIFQGWAYSSGALYQGVSASGGEAGLLLHNPDGSGVYTFIETRLVTTGKFYTRKIDEVTVDTAGESVSSQARLISDGAATTEVQKNPTVSGGNPWSQKVAGSGGGGGTLAGADISESEIVLKPGENVYIQAINQSSNALDCSIDVDFYEVPLDDIPELEG